MARNRIKFNSAAFRAILTGSGMRGEVYSVGGRLTSHAPGTSLRVIVGGFGGGRMVGFVTTNADDPVSLTIQREALEAAAHGM